MFKKLLLFILLFTLFIPSNAGAREAMQIELSASNNDVAVGESFQITVTLKNASMGNLNIGNIKIPGIEKFQEIGSSESTKIQMINGATTAVTETVLTLNALKEGKYNIGPVKINSKNLSAESNVITINVTKKAKQSFFGKSSPEDKTSLAGNKKTSAKWLVNTIAIILLFGMIFTLYRQKKQAEEINYNQAEETKESLENNFYLKIAGLDDEKFFEKTKKLLLEYIQKKYNIDTDALTSSEVIKELMRKRIYRANDIKKALKLCDQGSFAFNRSGKEELIKIIKLFK